MNSGVAETGWTQLEGRKGKHCHVVVFKIVRQFDVTVLKWEEKLDGSVKPGEDWKITATPQGDPFAVKQTETTDASGAAVLTGGKMEALQGRRGCLGFEDR